MQEWISGKALVYRGRNIVSGIVVTIAIGAAIGLIIEPNYPYFLPVLVVAALIFGYLLVMGIGGADGAGVARAATVDVGLVAALLAIVAIASAFFLLRHRPSNVASFNELNGTLTAGQPTVVEFYSNF